MEKLTNIQESLHQEGYLIDAVTADLVQACLTTRPTPGAFLFGPAGSGKTFLPEALARAMNREVFFFQCFPGTREDDLLVKLIPDENSTSGIAAHDGPVLEAAKASRYRSVFLVLDEWDKTRPSADAFLLDFLQSGRIKFNGRSCTANTRNLTVWVTMNDERELSEPLLRRLPIIHFSHLPASLVREALSSSHSGHPQIETALVLYERCLMAGLPKPATVQELRQLLDAISTLGDRADWDSLVFQFVTKTRESHALLKQSERIYIRSQQEERERLAVEAYEEAQEEEKEQEKISHSPVLPKLREVRGHEPEMATAPLDILPEDEQLGGIILRDDALYNHLTKEVEPSDDPTRLGDVAEVRDEHIIMHRSYRIEEKDQYSPLFGRKGEIVITDDGLTLDHIRLFQERGMLVVSFAREEIYGRSTGVECRFVLRGKTYSAEYICSTEDIQMLEEVFRDRNHPGLRRMVKQLTGYEFRHTDGTWPSWKNNPTLSLKIAETAISKGFQPYTGISNTCIGMRNGRMTYGHGYNATREIVQKLGLSLDKKDVLSHNDILRYWRMMSKEAQK